MVFYLFCWIIRRIIVTAIICYTLYIYKKKIGWRFFESTLAHLYTYVHIKILIYNGNLFPWIYLFLANICSLWINLLQQISFLSNFVHNLSSNILTWQTHLVTQPQSIINSSVENHRTQAILRFSVPFNLFEKMTTLIS